MAKSTNDSGARAANRGGSEALSGRWWWLVAALGVATLSLAYPVFGGGFLASVRSDQFIAGYAFREFAAESLRSGHGFPQWSPALFGGLPYVAAMHGDIFYPTFLLRMVMRTDLAMTWGFIIHLFLAGAFTLGFLRAWGLNKWSAGFGAMAYMMSGPIASYASPGHDGKLFVSALLPLALWMLVRAIRDGRLWAWGTFAFAVGLAVLSPHPQLLQYFLLASGAFACLLVWENSKSSNTEPNHAAAHDPVFIITRLGAALGAVIVGACIGAIQYWPVLGYVNSSPRANGREFEFASQFSFPPEELINTYLPQFSGILDSYWGRNQIHLHSEYLGVVVLLLAPLAFGAGSRKAFARFWLGTAVVALLWALGGFTPLFKLIYLLPGTKYFRAPSTMIFVATFAICVLSALGLERIMKRLVSARAALYYTLGWCTFGVIMAIFAGSGILTAFAHSLTQHIAATSGFDPVGFAAFVDQNGPALTAGALRSLIFLLVASAALLAFTRHKLNATVFAALILSVSAIDLWSIARFYWKFSEPATALFPSDPIIEYLKAQKQPARVFVYTKTADYRSPSDPYFGLDGFGRGTGFMVHGIRSVTGYQGNVLQRYQDISEGRFLVTPSFWRHENVRFLYTNMEIADTVLHKLAGPVDNTLGSRSYLYAMPGDNPYAWVAASMVAAPDSTAGRRVLTGAVDPRSVAVFEPSSHIGGKATDSVPTASAILAHVNDFSAGKAEIELSAPASAGSALVVSENYYPGWTALVDGKPAQVARADYNLLGVPLPAGAKRVSISFKDPRYDTGKTVTIIALLFTLALIGVGVRQRRSATPLPSPRQ